MFSVKQKREIADAVQKILRATNHPERPGGEIRFALHVSGADSWSWADIENNGAVRNPGVNPWSAGGAREGKIGMNTDDVLDIYVPGAWRCPKCDFHLSKATIFVQTGQIGVSRDDVMRMDGEVCPNDGESMARETWHERAEANQEWGMSLMNDIITATGVDNLPAALDEIKARFSERICRYCGEAIRPTGDGAWLDCETHTTCDSTDEHPLSHQPAEREKGSK